MTRRVVIEADGGSRGNPGPAAYGAVLKDADTGEVIAEDGTHHRRRQQQRRGVPRPDRGAEAGRRPRARRRHRGADGLQARGRADVGQLEDQAPRHEAAGAGGQPARAVRDDVHLGAARAEQARRPARQRGPRRQAQRRHGRSTRGERRAPDGGGDDEPTDGAEPSWVAWRRQVQTTLVLVRHGVTDHTRERRFSGGLQSTNPGLSDEGRDQIRTTADWLAPLGERVDAVVASPVRRARESGEILAERLGVPLEEEPGFAEMEFGTWDGLTFDEVAATERAALEKWLGSLDERPGGGESLVMVQERVLAALERLLARHAGRTVVVASHVTPIKVVVAEALQAPLTSQFRMELRPGLRHRRHVLHPARRATRCPARPSATPRCGSSTCSRPASTSSTSRPAGSAHSAHRGHSLGHGDHADRHPPDAHRDRRVGRVAAARGRRRGCRPRPARCPRRGR